jgi:short-subunit dehydrogenase
MAALPEISAKWSKPRDLTGENVLITGASGGLGLAVAKQVAENGGNLILAVRNVRKTSALAKQLSIATRGSIDVIELDLSNLKSIHSAADQVSKDIDILILNFGQSIIKILSVKEACNSDDNHQYNVKARDQNRKRTI